MTSLKRSKAMIGFACLVFITSLNGPVSAQQSINGTVSVSGEITDPSSARIPGARITLYSLDRILQTTTDRSGRFQFNGVPIGKYEFEVVAGGFKRVIKPDFSVGDPHNATQSKPLEMTIAMEIGETGSAHPEPVPPDFLPCCCGIHNSVVYQPRRTGEVDALGGVVTDGSSKEPVRAVTVRLVDKAGMQIAEQQTTERGAFEFKLVAPGQYRLTFQHSAYNKLGSYEFWVARENRTEGTFSLVPLGRFVVCQ